MAVKKSQLITDLDASPRTLQNPYVYGANIQTVQQHIAIAAADADGDIYRVMRLPDNARVVAVVVANTAITDGTDYDIGLYPTNSNTALDKDLWVDGVTMATARTSTDLTYNKLALTDSTKRIWELLGLTAPSYKLYDICITANTAGTAAGTIMVRVDFVI